MIEGNEIWNCVKSILGVLAAIAIGIGIAIGIILNFQPNNTPSDDGIIGHLAANTPKHSIPKNTMIVAACTDDCGVFAYVVKDTKGNHYYVGLLSREVRKIEEVNVIKLEKVLCEPNRQEFKYKVKEL